MTIRSATRHTSESRSSLTSRNGLDTMADMPIPDAWQPDLEPTTLLTLGLRAAWLHMQLVTAAGQVLAPRQREVLTCVATRPYGMPEPQLRSRMRALGLVDGDADTELHRLIGQGWLSAHDHAGQTWIDLPEADVTWIGAHTQRLIAHIDPTT